MILQKACKLFFSTFATMEREMERFEQAFEEAMRSDVLPMDVMIRYAASAHGKRLRPRLVFLSAQLFDAVNDSTRRAALFVEMLHTATLIHDDVVDESDMRRNQPSLYARFDSKLAVLAGDYLLSKAMLLLSTPEDDPILQEMLATMMAMTEGEVLQIRRQETEKREMKDLNQGLSTLEHYLDVIERKTARLIRACCVGGPLSVTSHLSPHIFHLVSDFGLNLGLIFQMRDDILDDDDPVTTSLAKQLLPEYLEKTLKALDALTPYVVDQKALSSLCELTVFCAERDH